MTEAVEDRPEAVAQGRERARTRKCIVTGDVLPEGRLVRFVAGPEGRVVVDVEAKLPGRGMWLRSDRAAVQRAVEKRLYSRAAKLSLSAS